MITQPQDLALNSAQLNEFSSQFAAEFGYNTTDLIERVVNRRIWDTEPKKFPLLKLLAMKPTEYVKGQEFNYAESGWQRNALQVTATATGVSYPATQVISVSS